MNRRVNRIRAAFRWAAGEELVPEPIHAALTAVPGLRRGEARDNPPRGPVDPRRVEERIACLEANGGLRRSHLDLDLDHDPPLLILAAHKTRDRIGEDLTSLQSAVIIDTMTSDDAMKDETTKGPKR